jgi:DNA-binding CsgD family transcriptional regulator
MHSPVLAYQRSIKALVSLKPTLREAEVLFWISQGKSNHDIGVILGAKTGAVCKHVEHILGRLNLENRATATVVAPETCRSDTPASESSHGQSWTAVAGFITTQLCALCSEGPELYGKFARPIA